MLKPNKIIIEAIKLQASFCRRQTHCHASIYPFPGRARIALFGSRLRKFLVVQFHIVAHFGERDGERRLSD